MAVESPGGSEEQQPSGSATVDEREPRDSRDTSDPDGERDPRLAFASSTDNASTAAPVPTQSDAEPATEPEPAADGDGWTDTAKAGEAPAARAAQDDAGSAEDGPRPKPKGKPAAAGTRSRPKAKAKAKSDAGAKPAGEDGKTPAPANADTGSSPKPGDAKSGDAKSGDAKPGGTKPGGTKPEGAKPEGTKPARGDARATSGGDETSGKGASGTPARDAGSGAKAAPRPKSKPAAKPKRAPAAKPAGDAGKAEGPTAAKPPTNDADSGAQPEAAPAARGGAGVKDDTATATFGVPAVPPAAPDTEGAAVSAPSPSKPKRGSAGDGGAGTRGGGRAGVAAAAAAAGAAVPGARADGDQKGSEGPQGASRGADGVPGGSEGSEAAEARVEGGGARAAGPTDSDASKDAPATGSDVSGDSASAASGASEGSPATSSGGSRDSASTGSDASGDSASAVSGASAGSPATSSGASRDSASTGSDTSGDSPAAGSGVSEDSPPTGSGASGTSGASGGSPASGAKDSATASFRLVAEAQAAKPDGDDQLRAAVAAWVTKSGDDVPSDAAPVDVPGDVEDEPSDAVPVVDEDGGKDGDGDSAAPPAAAPTGRLAGPPGSTFVPLRTDSDLPPKPAAPPPPPAAPPAIPRPAAAPDNAAPPKPAGAPAAPPVPPEPAAGPGATPGWERTQQQPLPPYEEKRPLDLLAELTNTPPPPETLTRTLVRRVKVWTPLVILLAIALGVIQMLRPLPAASLTLTADSSYAFEGGTPEMPWPSEGQASIDVAGLGSLGSYGKQKSVPIGSVAKVMTAYVILRDHPMKPGGNGASIPVDDTAVDEAGLSAEGETTVELDPDSKLSQKEALQALLIASANNVARLLARWHSDGDMQAFVDEMNRTAEELGMDGTTYTDPSGLKDTTVSTAEDQVILGKAAMKDPLFKQIVAMPVYTDSRGDDHDNSNKMVPLHGIGIKVGSTTKAGGNFLFATEKKVAGEQQLIVGAVLGQYAVPQLPTAMEFGRQLMAEGEKVLTDMTVVKKGDVVGEVDDGLGSTTPVVATEDVVAPGWGGLKVGLELGADRSGEVPHEGAKGDVVGVLTMGSGQGEVRVPVALAEDLSEPGMGAKLSRLG